MAASSTTALSFENSPVVAASSPAVDVAQQAREHAEGSQQIGAAHDVGDGFGEDRMNCPDRGQRQGEALFRPGLLKHEQAQQVD
jgi:hypothetical protein